MSTTGGVEALKVNKKGLEAEYRAEVKRLQSKIGELVMKNEFARKRCGLSVQSSRRYTALLDDDGPKP